MNRDDSGFRVASVLAMWVPSMLETNQTRGPSAEYGLRASVTMRGPCGEGDEASGNKIPEPTRGKDSPQEARTARGHPWRNKALDGLPPPPRQGSPLLTRSEPPMPMLMTSVMDLPEYPFHSPLRTRWHRAGTCDQPKPPSIKCCSRTSHFPILMPQAQLPGPGRGLLRPWCQLDPCHSQPQ